MSTPESVYVYNTLSHIFSTRGTTQVLEIEILPPALGGAEPLLQDGRFIGITKKALIGAFVIARRLFFDKVVYLSDAELLDDLRFIATTEGDSRTAPGAGSNDADVTAGDDVSGPASASAISAIILLFDCEHLTACNWRKRRLATLIKHTEGITTTPSDLLDVKRTTLAEQLETELTLLATYLCSPLHRHTKSPTLWQHRFWVISQLVRLRSSFESATRSDGNVSALLQAELAIVLRAGEKHPKNYYAFHYLRRVHRLLAEERLRDRDGQMDLMNEPTRCMIEATVKWCRAHPADISGWTFVLYLLGAVQDREVRSDVVDRVVRFALDVGWEGESLWTFVDLAARKFGLGRGVHVAKRAKYHES